MARWSYLWAVGPERVLWEANEPTELMQIDINSADWPELALLPDIGETMAKRIAEDRKEKGKFSSPQDLARVKGIGPKTVENLAPYVAPIPVSGTPSSAP
ncbi:MAG: ComEA family DNA-binding protein [Planctomycetaceae bacterium]